MTDSWQAIDQNSRGTLTAVSTVDGRTIVRLVADPATGALVVTGSGSGGVGTWYTVSGVINSSNQTFTIPVAVGSDFILVLVNQMQMQGIDYTYSVGVSTTTITMTTAPDASLSGLGFMAFVIS
jgi:hypothetical protein